MRTADLPISAIARAAHAREYREAVKGFRRDPCLSTRDRLAIQANLAHNIAAILGALAHEAHDEAVRPEGYRAPDAAAYSKAIRIHERAARAHRVATGWFGPAGYPARGGDSFHLARRHERAADFLRYRLAHPPRLGTQEAFGRDRFFGTFD